MFRSFTLSAFIMMSAAASAATLNNWEDAFLPLQDEAAEAGIIPFATTIARFYDETAPCAEGIAQRGADIYIVIWSMISCNILNYKPFSIRRPSVQKISATF